MVKDRGADVLQETTQRIVARLGLAGKMMAEVLAAACGLDGCDGGQQLQQGFRRVAGLGDDMKARRAQVDAFEEAPECRAIPGCR
jgi:hypothetical protein